jgi:hypothetical protein
MRQARDISSDLNSTEFGVCQAEDVILSLAREIALERVRRRVRPRVYQIYQLYVEQGWNISAVKEFFGVSAITVHFAAAWVRLNVSLEMLAGTDERHSS